MDLDFRLGWDILRYYGNNLCIMHLHLYGRMIEINYTLWSCRWIVKNTNIRVVNTYNLHLEMCVVLEFCTFGICHLTWQRRPFRFSFSAFYMAHFTQSNETSRLRDNLVRVTCHWVYGKHRFCSWQIKWKGKVEDFRCSSDFVEFSIAFYLPINTYTKGDKDQRYNTCEHYKWL